MVDPTQTAFVPGQWICDNVLCRLEEVEYLQQTGQPGCMVFLNFSKAYDRLSRPWVLYCMSIMFSFVLGGFRRIVHPPSDDEGAEQTWFEPEQRPRKRVPKRSVHGKQFPRGASKTFWRQDDQPWWQGRSFMTPCKARRSASVTLQVPMQEICTSATGNWQLTTASLVLIPLAQAAGATFSLQSPAAAFMAALVCGRHTAS